MEQSAIGNRVEVSAVDRLALDRVIEASLAVRDTAAQEDLPCATSANAQGEANNNAKMSNIGEETKVGTGMDSSSVVMDDAWHEAVASLLGTALDETEDSPVALKPPAWAPRPRWDGPQAPKTDLTKFHQNNPTLLHGEPQTQETQKPAQLQPSAAPLVEESHLPPVDSATAAACITPPEKSESSHTGGAPCASQGVEFYYDAIAQANAMGRAYEQHLLHGVWPDAYQEPPRIRTLLPPAFGGGDIGAVRSRIEMANARKRRELNPAAFCIECKLSIDAVVQHEAEAQGQLRFDAVANERTAVLESQKEQLYAGMLGEVLAPSSSSVTREEESSRNRSGTENSNKETREPAVAHVPGSVAAEIAECLDLGVTLSKDAHERLLQLEMLQGLPHWQKLTTTRKTEGRLQSSQKDCPREHYYGLAHTTKSQHDDVPNLFSNAEDLGRRTMGHLSSSDERGPLCDACALAKSTGDPGEAFMAVTIDSLLRTDEKEKRMIAAGMSSRTNDSHHYGDKNKASTTRSPKASGHTGWRDVHTDNRQRPLHAARSQRNYRNCGNSKRRRIGANG
ncbi:unnamed protein product [Amoebophrya sp. A25]|nr:unnamed protein product [Amoebophrya sp. A25]|eukprot:GSA25T00015105001.1